MALNITKANAQIRQLKQQSAAVSYSAQILTVYRDQLKQCWSGIEVDYLCKTLDAQIRSCKKLSEDIDRTCRDMALAIEDILREEVESDSSV